MKSASNSCYLSIPSLCHWCNILGFGWYLSQSCSLSLFSGLERFSFLFFLLHMQKWKSTVRSSGGACGDLSDWPGLPWGDIPTCCRDNHHISNSSNLLWIYSFRDWVKYHTNYHHIFPNISYMLVNFGETEEFGTRVLSCFEFPLDYFCEYFCPSRCHIEIQ